MYYVYIIKSKAHNWYYVGISKDAHKRLKEHNRGKTRSTNYYKPFDLVFKKEFENRAKARDYEKFLKIKSNKEKLISKLDI